MLSEQDEFLLSQLLDGDLSPDEAAALQARIDREPELRQTFAQMRRLHGALLDQRASQPQVDLPSLHTEIMDAVESSRQPAIIRFPLWTRAAGLLAAAAAIVLFFAVYRPAGAPHVEAPIQIAQNTPPRVVSADPSLNHETPAPTVTHMAVAVAPNPDIPNNTVRVRFNRPSSHRTGDTTVKISYVRSDSLATAMKARDTERQSRPTVSVVVAQRPRPQVGVVANPFDAPL